jgi:Holliday junction resolvase RusA-like endonuclease
MNKVILNAFFPGEPVTWKRAQGRGRRRFNSKFMENAKKRLRRQFKMIRPRWKCDGLARFGVQAIYQTSTRGDGDNFEKLVFDAFQGVIWENDEQIDEWQGRKDYAAPEKGIYLVVYKIGG